MKSRWTWTRWRSVKESSSKRLAFCPTILRKIRYVDNSATSSASHSRDTSPDKNQISSNGASVNHRNNVNHQPQACTATSNVITAIQIQPQSFQRQASLPKVSPAPSSSSSPCKQPSQNGSIHGQYSCHGENNSPHNLSNIVNTSALSNFNGPNSNNCCCSSNNLSIQVNNSPGVNGTTGENGGKVNTSATNASCCMVITSTTNGNSSNILVVSSPSGAVTTRCTNHVNSSTQSSGSCLTSNTSSTLSQATSCSTSAHPHPHRSLDSGSSLITAAAANHCCNTTPVNCNNCINCASSILTNTPAGLIESRKITSSRELKLSFFTDESPTHSQPPTITIRMKPDEQGRFGFNVKGGIDQRLPILVSRVAPNSPAETAFPKLTEGDQVLEVNGIDVTGLEHERVVSLIRSTKDSKVDGELVLLIRPNVYNQSLYDVKECDAQGDEEPNFEYVPVDASPASKARVRTGDRLYESIMLLKEGLETGNATLQFDQLYRKKMNESMSVSKLPENISKNRYRDIMPYDSTRVILKEGLTGDYINASFVNMEIPSSAIINRYIATQGPLTNTCSDFWLMIWEQRSSLIVSATPLVERGKIKCAKYWPESGEELEVGYDLTVICSKEVESPSMVEREFKLVKKLSSNGENGTTVGENHLVNGGSPGTESRDITHIQYTAWPDHGVPEDSSDFLYLVNKVRNIRMGSVDPVVVHCSAGIGRTGVLIMMETAMCLIEANEPIYPIEILKSMRDQRAMLIQTSSQFNFVCSAIYKVYKEGLVAPLKEFNQKTKA